MLKNKFISFQIILLLFHFSISYSQNKTDEMFNEVESYLNIANEMHADVLSKEYYESAYENYNNALVYRGDRANLIYVIDQLNESIKNLTILNADLEIKTDFFKDVISLRDQAIDNNSPKYATAEWNNAEKTLQKAILYYDDMEAAEASELLVEVTKSYNDAIYRSQQANSLIENWGPFNSANENLAQILAPQSYNKAMLHFNNALDNLADDDMESYQNEMLSAEDIFTFASQTTQEFAGNQSALIQARKDAKQVGADIYAGDSWLEAEEAMMKTASEFEDKNFSDLHELSLSTIDKYNIAKRIANKERFLASARSKIKLAEEAEAKKYAPITMYNSQIKFNKAVNLIDTASEDYDQIKKYAAIAGSEADKAVEITNLIKSIENGSSSIEQVILGWNILGNNHVKPVKTVSEPSPMITPVATVEPINHNEYSNSNLYHIDESDDEITINLTGMQFGYNETLLDFSDKEVLDSIVPVLNSYSDYSMTVKAYTDKIGTSSYNKIISTERAQNVVDYLQNKKSIPQSSVEVYGGGEEDCIFDNTTFEGRLKNNRVQIVLTKN